MHSACFLRSSRQRLCRHAGGGDDIVDLTSADYAIGADGNDILYGGAGNDTLNGGAGADIFQYAKRGGGNDVIEDFQPGVDKIQLFGAANVAEVQIALAGDHVTLSWGDETIVLNGITSSAGSNDWFQLG